MPPNFSFRIRPARDEYRREFGRGSNAALISRFRHTMVSRGGFGGCVRGRGHDPNDVVTLPWSPPVRRQCLVDDKLSL